MNNGVLIAIGLGAVAAAVVLANKKKEPSKIRFNPGQITTTSPGWNTDPVIRYSGTFQPINPPQSSHPGQV
jgi:hypothetical protein